MCRSILVLPLARTLRRTVAAGLALTLLAGCASSPSGPEGGQRPPGSDRPVDLSPVRAADPGTRLPAGWRHGVFMEIFVRGYRDSDGDGIGDLRGLTDRLDYLHDLGVRGIWLMPVTASADHDHGYAVDDYRRIERDYGSLADFDRLLRKAHARGIGVIMDYVLNHSADSNPLFQSSAADPMGPYRDWYIWVGQAPAGWDILGKNPWYPGKTGTYFAQFGANMPDFNFRNPAVVAFHHDNLRFWLNRGVDGFRFDAVPHLFENGKDAWYGQPESFQEMADVRTLVQGYSHRYLVCEATGDMQRWAAPETCGSAFAFGHQYDVVKAAKGDAEAIGKVAAYFGSAPATMATFLGNHDGFAGRRLWDQFGGDLGQYRLAAATLLLEPGTPFLLYGEEIGMAGGAGLKDDAELRIPMSWTGDANTAGFSHGRPFRPLATNAATENVASERHAPDSLFAWYRTLIHLRNDRASLAGGDFSAGFADGNVYGFRRRAGRETSQVLINYGTEAATVKLRALPAGARLRPLLPARGETVVADASGALELQLPAQSVRVFDLGSR